MKKPKSLYLFLILAAGLALLAVLAAVLYPRAVADRQRKSALNALSGERYQNVFLSMYDISTFDPEDFQKYLGIPVVRQDYCFSTASEVNQALDAVFASGNELKNIYLGLDPLMLYYSEKGDFERVRASFEKGWLAYADSHPEISFVAFFSFPSMKHWLSLRENEVQAYCILYRQLTSLLTARANIRAYYPGGEEWLICNPANYIDDFTANPLVSRQIFLLSFADDRLRITDENSEAMLAQTARLVAAERSQPTTYPDLSSWDIVFLGDSIFGNYEGSLSIPGVVNGLSGARTYNCAQGGISASDPGSDRFCFPKMAAQFINAAPDAQQDNFSRGTQEFLSSDRTDRKTCFLINFGINDYYCGYALENPEDASDINTYTGALRTGISVLRDKYPDALYFVMGPGQVAEFNYGTDLRSDVGGRLADYSAKAEELCGDMQLPYLELYQSFPEGNLSPDDVLLDGTHYNEIGRYLVGVRIIDFLSPYLQAATE